MKDGVSRTAKRHKGCLQDMEMGSHIHMIAERSIKRKPSIVLESEGNKSRIEHEEIDNRAKEKATIQFIKTDGEGLQAPHNYALVKTTGIGGYDVRRVLVESVSAVDIININCYKKMDLRMTNCNMSSH